MSFWLNLCRAFGGCKEKKPAEPKETTYHVHIHPEEAVGFEGQIRIDDGTVIKGERIDRMLKFIVPKSVSGWGAYLQVQADGFKLFDERFALAPPEVHHVDKVIGLEKNLVLMTRLRVDGRDTNVVVRDVTAFRLLEHVRNGREQTAIQFLDKVKELGFNGVRVLTTLSGWFNLTPAEAREALPRLAELAHQRGIYLNLVGLAGTNVPRDGNFLTTDEMLDHMRWLGEFARHNIAVGFVEVANENSHDSQSRVLRDWRFCRAAVDAVGRDLPVASGSNCCGESDELPPEHTVQGNVISVHTDRSRDKWNRTRHVRELELTSANNNKHMWSNEPIGFAEFDSGSRSTDPAEAFGQGVLSRVFNFTPTFHMDSGLQCALPGPVQEACAKAFIEGTQIIPDDVRPTFKNAGWHDSPVGSFKDGMAVRTYSAVWGDEGIVVALGLLPKREDPKLNADPQLGLKNGWRIVDLVREYPGIQVFKIAKG